MCVGAGGQSADKSGYTLFNPTPIDLRRALAADRPDATESPISVDAGAVQIEASFVEYTYNDDADGETSRFDLAPTNLKFGLTNRSDVQIIWTPYTFEEVGDGRDNDGFGDLQVRYKHNLWGNDEGSTALALLPFVTLPTGDDEIGVSDVEGGLVVPFAADLAAVGLDGFGLGTQVEVAFVQDEQPGGQDTELAHTLVLGYDVTDRIGVYGEYVGEASLGSDGQYVPILSGGATYELNPDTVLDAGFRAATEDEGDDLVLFAGITIRF
ncbi:MAG: transporter [Planctomycetota bacterium]